MKILVVGDSGIDKFQYGKCKRICPEAPVPVFNPTYETKNLGMAGNVYANIEALTGATLLSNPEKPIKTRLVDEMSNQMLLRVDEKDKIERIGSLQFIKEHQWDAIVISDYNKGYLAEEDIQKISEWAKSKNIPTFLDTKKKIGEWANDIQFIKINEKEHFENEGMFDFFKNHLIVTLGDRGAMHFDRHIGTLTQYPLQDKAEVRDLSGAGDTFMAGLVVKYVETGDIAESIHYANRCASWAVTQKGVVVVDKSKI